ncbi:uncharacterized protein [Watersipora subatra]|uniref:uncharacterized protein n=1 Tax=Watersipora subatra TaxID=2589382 RepID=UPI00355AFE0C
MAGALTDPPSAASKSNEEKLSEGILLLLKPSIESLDDKVAKLKSSQAELNSSISHVGEGLRGIADHLPNASNLDPHIKRLTNARRKVNMINSILTNCQERLRKLHASIHKDGYRKEQALKQSLAKKHSVQKQESSSVETDANTNSSSESSHSQEVPSPKAVTDSQEVASAKEVDTQEQLQSEGATTSQGVTTSEKDLEPSEKIEQPQPLSAEVEVALSVNDKSEQAADSTVQLNEAETSQSSLETEKIADESVSTSDDL